MHSKLSIRPRGARAAAALGLVLAAAAAVSPAWASGERAGTAVAAKPAAGKPQSGVTVTPVLPARIAVGETVVLQLQIGGVSDEAGAGVEVRDAATRALLLSTRLAQGERRTLEVPYTGRADGMQFITVVTSQAGRATVLSLPLRVGSGELKLKPQGERRATASGDAVISLPAATPASR